MSELVTQLVNNMDLRDASASKNGDQMGTKKLILVPMGTKVPKWGPLWEQCSRAIKIC